MLFQSFFKTLIGQEVIVELKNDLAIRGILHSVDQYLNFKLTEITVVNGEIYPQLASVKDIFLRGSVVRYVHIPEDQVDVELLQDATRNQLQEKKATAAASAAKA